MKVLSNLNVPGHEDIFVIGDTAWVEGPDGKPVPGIAPAAKQQGAYVAKVIKSRIEGKTPPMPFRYKHQGNLATIGRGAAVVDMGRFKLKGLIAWWFWALRTSSSLLEREAVPPSPGAGSGLTSPASIAPG